VAEVPVRRGRAFAPSHVTGLVLPRVEARDPRERGSLGAGIVLDVGVTATVAWRPASRPRVRVRSNVGSDLPISKDAARRLLRDRPGELEVRLEHALPVGAGFGSSASGALATSLAVASALELPQRRAVEVAHLADLFGQGGLGGVAAILGGGLELRLRPGLPPAGRSLRLPYDRPVTVGTLGRPIPTRTVLSDPAWLRRFSRAQGLYDLLVEDRTPEGFWTAAERFTDTIGLASPTLRAVLRGLRRRRARAAQAMFGESFLAEIPAGRAGAVARSWLSDRSISMHEGLPAARGARALPSQA
jgi:pantoate kinase